MGHCPRPADEAQTGNERGRPTAPGSLRRTLDEEGRLVSVPSRGCTRSSAGPACDAAVVLHHCDRWLRCRHVFTIHMTTPATAPVIEMTLRMVATWPPRSTW